MSPSAGPCEWLLAEASTHLLRSTAVRTPNYHVLRAQSIVRSFTISYDFHVPIFAWTETLSQKVCYWMIQPSRPSLLCRYGLCLVGHVMLWISSSKFANAWAKDIRTDSYSAETVRSFSMGPLEKTWKNKGNYPMSLLEASTCSSGCSASTCFGGLLTYANSVGPSDRSEFDMWSGHKDRCSTSCERKLDINWAVLLYTPKLKEPVESGWIHPVI